MWLGDRRASGSQARDLPCVPGSGTHPWREDATTDSWGTFCYLRDVASGTFWSNAHQPTLKRADHYEAIFSEGRAEFRRSDLD